MARKCDLSNKKKLKGNNVSHALNRTIRHWKPNLRKVKVLVNGKPKTLRVSMKSYKSLKKGKIKNTKLAFVYTAPKKAK